MWRRVVAPHMSTASWKQAWWVWPLFFFVFGFIGIGAWSLYNPLQATVAWRTIIETIVFPLLWVLKNAPSWFWTVVVYGFIAALSLWVIVVAYEQFRSVIRWISKLF